MKRFLILLLWLASAAGLLATTWNSDGSQVDVNTKLALAHAAGAGNIVTVPPGPFTWGTGGVATDAMDCILQGAGDGVTIITFALDSPGGYGPGTIRITGGGTIGWMTFINRGGASFLTAYGVNNWVFRNFTYYGSATNHRTVFPYSFGVIAYGHFIAAGNDEMIWPNGATSQGPWQIPEASFLGTNQAVFIENCTFNGGTTGSAYICDNAYGAVTVYRFNTMPNWVMKIDSHGRETVSRGARSTEAYFNTWNGSAYMSCFDIRGGKIMLSNNKVTVTSSGDWFGIHDYATEEGNQLGNYGYKYNTPLSWPAQDQVGVGMDHSGVQTGGEEPGYVWGNTMNGSPWVFGAHSPEYCESFFVTAAVTYHTGDTSIQLVSRSGNGTGCIGVHDYIAFAGDDHRYAIATGCGPWPGLPATIVLQAPGLQPPGGVMAPSTAVANGAITLYQHQTGNPTATFNHVGAAPATIQYDRDVFTDQSISGGWDNFNGTTGGGHGTYAAMMAKDMTNGVDGVFWWVEDRGTWNTENATVGAPGYGKGQGQLWRWTHALGWTFYYEYYTYPHPLLGALAAPTWISQPVNMTVAETTNTNYAATASGNPSPAQQWQVSTNGGSSWSDLSNAGVYSGVTTNVLQITNVTLGMTTYQYRCVATNSRGTSNSSAALLTVTSLGDVTPPTPNPPTFASTSHTSSTVSASLNALSDAGQSLPIGVTFRLYASDGTTLLQSPGRLPDTSVTFSGLTAATLYKLTAQAEDSVGNIGTESTAQSITTDVSTPVQRARRGAGAGRVLP
jgi:hypothetical protein